MVEGELFLVETARFQDAKREGVAEREDRGGRRRGRELEGAGLLDAAQLDDDVRVLPERGAFAGGDGDQPGADLLEGGEEPGDFLGLAAVGDGEDDVGGQDPSQVAVIGLGGVEEDGRRAGRGEGGGDLLAHEARLAHAGDHQVAFAADDGLDGGVELAAEALGQGQHGLGLDLEDLPTLIPIHKA